MKSNKFIIFIVALIIAGLTYVAFFGLNIQIGDQQLPEIKGAKDMRFGIDIRGGVEAVYEPKDLDHPPTSDDLNRAKAIFETRLDGLGILDREIYVEPASGTVIVRFPWKSDETEFISKDAVAELGGTAQLTFRDDQNNVLLDGGLVASAVPELNEARKQDPNESRYVIQLTFNEEGKTKFAEATQANVGKSIGIFMDETLISNPRVQEAINEGQARITGYDTMEDAKYLADRISAGALPFALETKSNSIISPTLGAGALDVMTKAGLIAFMLICLFMIFYYRLPGFVACLALTLQVVGQLLALSIPQFTLTLAGIAGIVLSIGMGVDANVIISERIKEEMNNGRTLKSGIQAGFHRAFSSVFDGNVTVMIVAVIMWFFGSGALLSFAYSLFTGVLLNFLAGVTASRLMIKSLSCYNGLQKPSLYGARRAK